MHVAAPLCAQQQDEPARHLADAGGERRAHHTHVETIDKQGIEEDIQHGAGRDSYHSVAGVALKSQLIVQRQRRHHKRRSDEDKQQIIIGMRHDIGGSTHHPRKRSEEEKSDDSGNGTEAHRRQETSGGHLLGIVVFFRAKRCRDIVSRAVTEEKTDGVDESHVGERHSHARSSLGGEVTDEKRIDDVVERNHQHGDDSRDCHLHNQLTHRTFRHHDKTGLPMLHVKIIIGAKNAFHSAKIQKIKVRNIIFLIFAGYIIYIGEKFFMEEKELNEEEILDENISETTEDVDSLLKSAPQKINMKDEDQEDTLVNKQDDGEEFKATWPLHDDMKKTLTNDFHRGCRIKAEKYEFASNVLHHGQCKLDSFNWLKDYENETPKEGELQVAEVRFKNDRKDFFSYPSEMHLLEGELVAVETAIGHDIGIVTMVGELIEKQRKRKKNSTPVAELKKIYRRARINDVEKFIEAIRQEDHTLYRSREIASSLNLEMKLNDIEYQGDRTKAIFYYTADGRVDFRELIKKLAEEFHVRVEMRQIGFRQESAKLGGIGSCGRELCCASWITDFQSVTTNVARVQQLSPNPQKLAGQCGKLKCCLNYEYDAYVDALKGFPDNRIVLKTKKGDGIYQKIDIFKGLMWYSYPFDRNNMMAIPVEKVKQIIEDNKKGVFPEQLEDFAFIKEQKNNDYGEEGKPADLSKLE